jgi:hypothetical protein
MNDRPSKAFRLRELEGKFCKLIDQGWRHDATFADCDGVSFLCPLCFERNGGAIGTHMVICWKPSVPAHITPGPGRWDQHGSGLDDLRLVAGSSSILLQGGCGWHGWVGNNNVPPGYAQ